ncbi:TonB family protein [Ancylothrix sp. C2]|uniref:TonB family protein n=1 Tax=Ancylothrix sp. D3o TaxID=2953691 RepID=UPI0021BB6398|nr:TonB family protein [Ancylothrix sp. D3o]MCT7952150.1 TonB family protein [Ancylothrix sp. D3o]
MSVSNFSAAQREQQQQKLKKFLALSFLASAVLHGVVLPFSLNFVNAAEAEEEPIEFVVVEEPETKAVEPEPVAEKEVAPPPEPAKTETVEEIPKEEPVTPPPTLKEEPVTPPPTLKEEPVTPPPTLKEEAVAPPPTLKEEPVTPPPTLKEEAVAPPPTVKEEPVTPPPTVKEEPVTPPPTLKEEPVSPPITNSPVSPPADTSEPPQTDNSNPPATDPPANEPPVTASRPSGGGSTDFMSDAPNPNKSENLGESEPNSSPARGSDTGEPLSEPFGNNSPPIDRPPTTDPPVTAYRPGGGSSSGDSLSDLVNPSSPDIPGGDSSVGNNWNSSSADAGNSDGIGSGEPFGNNSGAMQRAPRNTDPPVSAYRPGGGSSSGGGFPDLGDPGSSGIPGGDGGGDSGGGYNGNSSSGGAGSGDGIGSSEPFGGGIGAMPKPESSTAGSGRPSGGSGGTPGVCVSCNKPAYPISARRQKREGVVEVLLNIDPDGNVVDASIATSSGHEDFDQAAINTVRNWKFSSSESGVQGKIVAVRFDLDD